jgi:SAM-dependent methyltransferase
MNNVPSTFKAYALAYDALYQEKDYAAETRFINEIAKRFSIIPVESILDLGCGTGGHAIPLASQGYKVTGVDMSNEMLVQARAKAANVVKDGNLSFLEGDIAEIQLAEQFDMIICMFAVLSYQITNERLAQTFSTVRKHLRKGGVFLCDFWYGPAVLRDLPTKREKWVTENTRQIHRVATPSIDFNANVVRVTYDTAILSGNQVIQSDTETHTMRYLFLPELSLYGQLNDLKLTHSSNCCSLAEMASEKTWTVSAAFTG